MSQAKLSPIAETILQHIANGYSYDQILRELPDITRTDIFDAAREALTIVDKSAITGSVETRTIENENKIIPLDERDTTWNAEDDTQLRDLLHAGKSIEDMAQILKRHPNEVQTRLNQLTNPKSPSAPNEQTDDIPRIMVQNID